jgi:hypothetical protein
MSMDGVVDIELEAEGEMARNGAKSSVNERLISQYVGALRATGTDDVAFTTVFESIMSDGTLRAGEVVAIANRFAVAGTKATSKATAIVRIKRRHVELVRTERNLKIAAKARPW